MTAFWDLAGPARFVTDIEHDLRGAHAVVVMLPRTVDIGPFKTALERRVRTCELWSWRSLDVREEPNAGVAPLEYLFDRIRAFGSSQQATTSALAALPDGQGLVFFVHGLTPGGWAQWMTFIRDYLQVTRNTGARDAPRFCLCVSGAHNPGDVRPVAGLVVRTFDRYVDEYDVSMLVRPYLAERVSPVQARVATAVCSEIAGPDERLALALAQASLDTVLTPVSLLKQEAAYRGWDAQSVPIDWASGRLEVWGGRIRKNSVAVAAASEDDEITRRVWKGQIKILFPAIEEVRVMLASELAPYCELPFVSRFGTFDHVGDLEIPHLLYFARANRAPRRLVQLLTILADIRHALAHLEAVSTEHLTNPLFLEACAL